MKRRTFLGAAVAGLGLKTCRISLAAQLVSNDGIDEVPLPTPNGAHVLFDGKDLAAWKGSRKPEPGWKVENGYVEVTTRTTGNLVSKEIFEDFQLHLEFWVPYLPDKKGQERGNSGVYLQDKYEVQILDSYGFEPTKDACGALYQAVAPLRNVCKKPETWQAYDIAFRAPRFRDSGEMAEKGRLTVFHNRVLIHDNLEIPGMTGWAAVNPRSDPHQPGPIVLQDHGNPVRFRNIWIIPC